jgi:hypothetical protein
MLFYTPDEVNAGVINVIFYNLQKEMCEWLHQQKDYT